MIRRTLTVTVLTAAIVTAPGVASAHPVSDPTSAPYCTGGAPWVGANGDQYGCAQPDPAPDKPDDAGIIAAIGAVWAVAFFAF
jgi:hypothetical protein